METNSSGNLAQWVGGIGTTLAFLLTSLVLLWGRRTARRQQADNVYLIPNPEDDYPWQLKGTIRNGSSFPIYEIHLFGRRWPRERRSIRAIGGDGRPYEEFNLSKTEREDGSRLLMYLDKSAEYALEKVVYEHTRYMFTLLTFRDVTGKRWVKKYVGITPTYLTKFSYYRAKYSRHALNRLDVLANVRYLRNAIRERL